MLMGYEAVLVEDRWNRNGHATAMSICHVFMFLGINATCQQAGTLLDVVSPKQNNVISLS